MLLPVNPAPSPRWITPEFLEVCHPSIREIHVYWDGKRRGRRMPSRADIDPAEMIPFLPNLMLVDVASVEPLSLVYRLVGTREVTARGNDPTGRTVAEAFYGRSLDGALGNYRAVIEGRAPVFDPDDKASPHGRLSERGSIFLPLSDDGETVNKVMVYTAYKAF
jgi:hypothetical protein